MKKKTINNTYKTRYKCKSINLSKLINTCTENDITLYNLEKGERFSTFELSEQDSKKMQKLSLSNFQIAIEKQGGVELLKKTLISHIGLILGIIVSLVAFFCVENKMLQLHITGMTSIDKSEIEEEIHTYGINYFSSLNFDKSALEKHLAHKFDFSLVSVISKGNSLIINVKESIKDIENDYAPITADCNMIIRSIEVYAGTKTIDVGDIVFKGDILVQPFYTSDSDIVYVEPRAKIVAEVFFSESYTFLEKETIQVRSGQKSTLYKNLSLGKIPLISVENTNPFENYEIEEKKREMVNYFLPIVERLTISYELVEVEQTRDFESQKDAIISKLKEKVYEEIFTNVQDIKEDVNITEISNGKIINFSVSGVYTFKYVLNSL